MSCLPHPSKSKIKCEYLGSHHLAKPPGREVCPEALVLDHGGFCAVPRQHCARPGGWVCPSPSSSSLPTSGWGRFLPIWFTLWGSLSQEYSWVVLTIPTPPSHICRIFASIGAGPGDRARSKAGLGCLSQQLLLKGLVPKMDFPPLKLPMPFFVSGAGVTVLVLQCLLACTTPSVCCLALTKPGAVLRACNLSAGEVEKFKVSFSCKASVKAGWTT